MVSKIPFALFIIQKRKEKKGDYSERKKERNSGEEELARLGGSPKVEGDKNEYGYRSGGREESTLQHVRTLRFARGDAEEKWAREQRRGGSRVARKRKGKTRSPFVAGSHNGDRRASEQSLMQSMYVYRGCCVFVGMAPAGSSPTGRGNRFIGHPVHGI